MAILTIPSVQKGVTASLQLSKLELAQIPMVSNDSYFSNMLNWYRVNVVYMSNSGGQYEIVEFDATQSNPTGNFLVSTHARNQFIVDKIIILDFDGGFLEIPNSEFPQFNINF